MKEDCKNLEDFIYRLGDAAKRHTLTEMVIGHIPIATMSRFIYNYKEDPLGFSSVTIRKIAERIDELEGGKKYQNELKKLIRKIVKTHIVVTTQVILCTDYGLNYKTIRKIKDFELKTAYHLTTLVQYAERVEGKRKEELNAEYQGI